MVILAMVTTATMQADPRPRDAGVIVGTLPTGEHNAITDVEGVHVGHTTVIEDLPGGRAVRTGVTAVLPHGGNLFRDKVPAAVHVYNAFGKAAGLLQVEELGQIETPIVLTNTLSVGEALSATVRWSLDQPGNERVGSVNAVVGETNDGGLSDIRGMHVTREHVIAAIESAAEGPVAEGNVGAGTGTRALGFKGGIGTSSRVVTLGDDSYTVGVLIQANFGRDLRVLGVPIGSLLRAEDEGDGDGSCMVIIATDAPLDTRDLERVARRSFNGLVRTTSVMSNGSGDFAIAFSTGYRVMDRSREMISTRFATAFFQAVEEATEEAVYNALFAAETMTGHRGRTAEELPVGRTLELLRERGVLEEND
ncbi:MAG: P1 family peptidase [Planctomycetota bacterium]